jgi:hypothetical protein
MILSQPSVSVGPSSHDGVNEHRYRQWGGNQHTAPQGQPCERAGRGEVHGLAQVLLDELRRRHRLHAG